MSDLVGKIIEYEQGEMDDTRTIQFFSELIKTGMISNLQGHYGRMAAALVEGGYLDREGNILLPGDEPI